MAGRDYTSDKGIATILIIIINFVYLNSATETHFQSNSMGMSVTLTVRVRV